MYRVPCTSQATKSLILGVVYVVHGTNKKYQIRLTMNAKTSRDLQKRIYRLEKLLKVEGRNATLEELLKDTRFRLSLLVVTCDNCQQEFKPSRTGILKETCSKCNALLSQRKYDQKIAETKRKTTNE